MNRTQDNISFYNRFFKTNVHPKCMIINSTYTVYKRGTKNNQRKQSMPSSDRYIHVFLFFSFFFLQNATWTALTYTTNSIPSNISFKISDRGSVLSLQLTFCLNKSTVYAASLHTCIQTEISTVKTETSSFKEINTDCFGEVRAKVARKYLIKDAASKERYCSFSTETPMLLSYWVEAHKTQRYTDCFDTVWTEKD